ncbi:hypothetical protein D3C86_1472260 [compost metagenome]
MQRVADQVIQQPLHRHPPQGKGLNRLQAQLDFFFILVVRRGDFAHQVSQVHLFHRLVTAIADESQELVENRVHVFDIAHHVVRQVAVVAHQLQGQPQTGQRRAQVVGHPGQHQFTLAASLFDVFGHLVEGTVNLGHFTGRVADRQAHAATLAELPRGKHQTLQGLIELTHEDPRRSGRQQADGQEPAEYVPDFLTAQRVRIQRHFQPAVTQAWRPDPQRRWRMHA